MKARKILSIILAIAMILTSMSVAFAEEFDSAADYILYVNAEWADKKVDDDLGDGMIFGTNAFASLEDAAAKIATDGSNTTIKLLSDVEVGTIDLKYGEGDVILTADFPVVIKQPNLSTDLRLVESKAMNFVIDTNVTFEVYDNDSGVYLYYGPSITINGAVTGGQNWGCLYLYNGEHTVSETGTIGVGRIQIGATTLTVNGTVDTNYLLVEGSNFVANGATVDATDVYDSNKGGMRWGASTFEFTNGSVVNAGTVTLGYADSALTIDTTSTLTANKIKGKGTIVIDAANYTAGDELNIQADFSGFTGKFDVINENGTALMASVDGDKIVLTEAAASVTDANGNSKGSFASLKEAFDAASEGDIVLLHKAPGNGVTIPKAVTLRGDAPSLTRSLTTDGMVEFNNCPLTVASGIDGTVKVENIAFTGTANQTVYIPVGGNYENTNLEIDNCYFEYNLNRGIIVNSQLKGFELTNSVIENKSTSYIKDYSVWFNPKAPSEVEISNNEFIGGGLLRGAMHLGETAPDNATITVSGNSVDGFERGIQMAQSGSVTIDVDDNTFTNIAKGTGSSSGDNEFGAIYIHKVATTDAKLNITDNNIDDSASLIYSQNHYSANDFIANFDGNTAGNETIVTPNESTTIYDYTAAVGNKYYDNLEDAFKDVQDGETIELGKDVYLTNLITFDKDITFTLDGKGHSIKPAASFASNVHAIQLGRTANLSDIATKKYTVKNVVFDGWSTAHVLRLQGVDAKVQNCKFVNCNQTGGQGLLTLTYCESEVTGCSFIDNVCLMAIDVNYNANNDGDTNTIIDNCVFSNNESNCPALILYSDGVGLKIRNSVFTNNVVNTTLNGAVVYLDEFAGSEVTGCTFTGNVINTPSATDKRVASAIFFGNADAVIKNNVFYANSGTRNGAPAEIAQVVYTAGAAQGDLGENYWGGNRPVAGADYALVTDSYGVDIESYYSELDADGNPTTIIYTPVDMTTVNKKVVLEQVMNGTEGTHEFKVYLEGEYNNTEAVIDNLVAAEIDFEVTGEFAILGFEVSDSKWTSEVTANGSYLIREKGEANGTADIDGTRIFLGTITLEGYGDGTIEAACHYGAVEQRTASNNIVVSTIADPYALPFSVYVPRKDLTVEIDFNNAADKNVDAYQEMQVVVSGGDLAKAITVDLGNADKDVALDLKSKPGAKYTVDVDVDNKYIVTFEDALTLDTTYTVTVSGAGYRTVRKNATMANDVTVKFWNNVKDAEGADYLAGDIVKDNTINIYDLSAVVSYFGRTNDTSAYSKYARYDLNRDGKIDSKDVAYVLVSWGK